MRCLLCRCVCSVNAANVASLCGYHMIVHVVYVDVVCVRVVRQVTCEM